MNGNAASRKITTIERPGIPLLSFVLGFGPVLVIAAGALLSALLPEPVRGFSIIATNVIAGSILAFLAGVRRGLSFRTEGGPRPAQVCTTLGIYGLAFASLFASASAWPKAASSLAALGFALVMILDPIAARQGEVPWFFSRLRPPQMLIAVLSLGGLVLVLGSHA